MGRRQTPEQKREYNRERYRKNRDKILAQQKERYEQEKPKILEDRARYYRENRDKVLARVKQHYQDNSEKVKERSRQARLTRKREATALLGGKCKSCPVDHPMLLEFHHKDPATKLFSISDMITNRKMVPDAEFEAEVLKCELLCKNCHAMAHCSWEV